MKAHAWLHPMIRALAAAAVAGGLLAAWPAAWLAPVGRLAAAVTTHLNPWIDQLATQTDGFQLRITGRILPGMTLPDGTTPPPMFGTWSKPGIAVLPIGLVTLAAWAMVPAGRRRWRVLPLTLGLALLAAVFMLSIEIQQTTLQAICFDWLPQHAFADTPANYAAFARLKRAYGINCWIQSFHDAGGNLFYGLLAGWIAFVLPRPPSSGIVLDTPIGTRS